MSPETIEVCLSIIREIVPDLVNFCKLGFRITVEFDTDPYDVDGPRKTGPFLKDDLPTTPDGIPMVDIYGNDRRYRIFMENAVINVLNCHNSLRLGSDETPQEVIQFPLADPDFNSKKIIEAIKKMEEEIFQTRIKNSNQSLSMLAQSVSPQSLSKKM
jgi:hypothetical protein